MTIIQLAVFLLAVFAVSWDISSEEGPFRILERIRNRLDGVLGDGVHCPICVSFWASIALYAVWISPFAWVLIPLAAHGFVTLSVLMAKR